MSFGPVGGLYLWTRMVRGPCNAKTLKGNSNASCLQEAPPGIRTDAKKRMVHKINTAIEEVYPIGETLIFLREYPLDNVALNGGLQSENPHDHAA